MKSNKNKILQKVKPIVIGMSENNEPIIITARTRGLIDSEYNKALSRLYAENKIPFREKTLPEMTPAEKEIYNIRSDKDTKIKMITCYDETNPKFIEKKSEIEGLRFIISLASYLKMDEKCIEVEDGNKISHYEDFELDSKMDLYDLSKWIIDIMKISENDVEEYFLKEIQRLKKGGTTLGELYLNPPDNKNKSEIALDKVLADLNDGL